jgi:hypothetical protein
LAERLELPNLRKDGAGRVQLCLQFDPEQAYNAVVAALDEGAYWRSDVTVVGPHDEGAEVAEQTA